MPSRKKAKVNHHSRWRWSLSITFSPDFVPLHSPCLSRYHQHHASSLTAAFYQCWLLVVVVVYQGPSSSHYFLSILEIFETLDSPPLANLAWGLGPSRVWARLQLAFARLRDQVRIGSPPGCGPEAENAGGEWASRTNGAPSRIWSLRTDLNPMDSLLVCYEGWQTFVWIWRPWVWRSRPLAGMLWKENQSRFGWLGVCLREWPIARPCYGELNSQQVWCCETQIEESFRSCRH